MALGVALGLCWGLLGAAVADGHHSLAVLVTAVTHEEGSYHYLMITQLDDVKIAYYSSATREVRPTQQWVAQAVGVEYLQEKTKQFRRYDESSKFDTRWWMQLHNQTGGIHTEQVHLGCALSGQALVDPMYQVAYDGRDFISFDAQTGTWVAAVQLAFLQKHRWETGKSWTQYVRWWLKQECLETLQSLVQQGRGLLEQQVPPMVSVSRRDTPSGSVTLSCQARGFYPRPIHISWVRDGEDILVETDSSGILPNADGTYYTQSSLEISPQQEDRHRYACQPLGRRAPCPLESWPPSSWPCWFRLEPASSCGEENQQAPPNPATLQQPQRLETILPPALHREQTPRVWDPRARCRDPAQLLSPLPGRSLSSDSLRLWGEILAWSL